MTPPKWTVVGEITVSNAIPGLSTPKPTVDDYVKGEATAQHGQSESQKECLEKII